MYTNFLKEIVVGHFQILFIKNNRDTFWENEGIKNMKEDMWSRIFS